MLWVAIVRILFACVFLLCSVTSCKRSGSPISSTPAPPPSPARALQLHKVEACRLITKEEVGAVQGTTISDTKSSEGSDRTYLITQCYYAATGPNLSVSLAITQPDPRNPTTRSAREQWEQTFGRFENEKEEVKGEEEKKGRGREEERTTPPKKIEGIGEEAFWAGNRVGGALYVLKRDVFIRISVGGPGDEQSKLEKSKQLAQKGLSRLP